jgi:hypothetical protein
MRGKPLRGGSMSSRSRVLGACVVALAGICLGSISTASAGAVVCPNAQFRSGASEHLPDCRAYEQVSPVEKGGLDAVALQPPEPTQSAPCGAGEICTIAYMNVGAAFGGARGNEFSNAYIAARTPEGWRTTALTPPTPQAPANSLAKVTYAFSGDLSQAVLRVPLQQLTEGAPAGVYNLYARQGDGSYSLVTASAPAEPPQSGCGDCFEAQDVPAFAGASSDFGHVIFEANDSLVVGAPGAGVENLYETVAGRVRLVGILPDDTIPPGGATAGGGITINERTHELEHAISADGSRVLFEAAADGGGPDAQQAGDIELFDRIGGARTVEISAPAPGAQPSKCETEERVCDAQPAKFWAASEDGSVVYFTSKAALTKESRTGPEHGENPGNDLYRYDVDTGTLTDLSVDANDPNGASVLGVVGASADGSYVYFVATGELGATNEPEAALVSGLPKLYVWHKTAEVVPQLRFIAALQAPTGKEEANIEAMRGLPYHSDVADWTSRPTESQAYLTPDGRHLAFMSVKPLTGYENKDRITGEADHEVFEYSAETGQLVCASCDPGGAPPLGSAFIGATLGERASTPFHQPRSLSDDGSRLFFSSPDPLVPGLAGGSVKIFEYEDGSAQPISGMQAGGEYVFLDASASGNDVFFATREQLAPTDIDELADVYDARVDGGLPAPVAPTPCQGSACEGSPNPPPLFSSPTSSSFVGPGNPPTPPPVARLTRKQLLSRALAKCRKLTSKKKRTACVNAANRRYAPTHKRARHQAVMKRRS